ncbi:MAG: hypothetical protein WCK84_05150 [Bacteroidota bacterium]
MRRFLKILQIILWVLLVTGAVVLVGFVEVQQYSRPCKNVVINIDYNAADVLITKKDIDSILLKTAGMIIGKPLGYINTGSIERSIRKQPYVANVSVFENNEGTIFIYVHQRQPLLRIINNKQESFYLDKAGYLLPVNQNFSARVLVANGFINDSYKKKTGYKVNISALSDSILSDSVITNLYKLSMYISNDTFLKSQIDQIYVNEFCEFELIPRIGNHVIIFGAVDDLDDKFRKLFAFYRLGLNKIGWNKYNHINIKFKNQVVCSKI